ncbi:MAG TPA: Hsp20/alpha crystallin family protein [Chloroflexia bacterium]|nr:Hsp20/alpha crystallin family protein [Chloroflexia bacterium]
MSDRINQQRASGEYRGNEQRREGEIVRREPESTREMAPYGGYSSPWELMERFSEDVDRMFSSMGLGPLGFGRRMGRRGPRMRGMMEMQPGGRGMAMWTPNVDVITRGDDLVVEAELPGINPDDVEVECEANRLIIKGESRDERSDEDKERGYRYSERRYGSFYRAIPLPEGVNTDNAQANFKNGVLEVTFPGAARQITPERRRIPIQGTSRPAEQQQIGQGTSTGTTTGTQAGYGMQGQPGTQGAQGTTGTYGQSTPPTEGREAGS